MFVIYVPCKTCIAWLVTEPEEFAMGDAVALIPPTSDAIAAVGLNKDSTSVPTV